MNAKTPKPSVRKFVQRFLAGKKSEHTKSAYSYGLASFCLHLALRADAPIDTLTPEEFKSFEALDQRKSVSLIHTRNMKATRSMIRFAIHRRYLPPDFLTQVVVGKQQVAAQVVAVPVAASPAKVAPPTITSIASPVVQPGAAAQSASAQPAGGAHCLDCKEVGQCKLGIPGQVEPPKSGEKCPFAKCRRTKFFALMDPNAPGGQKVECTAPPKMMLGAPLCRARRMGIIAHATKSEAVPANPTRVPHKKP